GPTIAKPNRRQHMKFGSFRSPIVNGDLDQNILRRLLCIFDEDIEVPILIKNAGVDQFIFKLLAISSGVGLNQFVVRIGGLWVLVQVLHVGVGRGAVQVEVVLLDVLAVVSFAVGQSEQTLLENRILAVP